MRDDLQTELPDIPPERQTMGYRLVADGIVTPEEADRMSGPNWRMPLPLADECEDVPAWQAHVALAMVAVLGLAMLGGLGLLVFVVLRALLG